MTGPEGNSIHLMYGPKGNSYFCFPESPEVSRDEIEGNIRTRGKTKLTSFQRNHTLSVFFIYLDFPLNNHIAKTSKQRRRAGNNCAIVSRSGYIWIWSRARDQESTNHSAHFVEWKSSYITMNFVSRGSQCFPRRKICYIAKQTKANLKNALRFQRQHQATSDHVQQRSTFHG